MIDTEDSDAFIRLKETLQQQSMRSLLISRIKNHENFDFYYERDIAADSFSTYGEWLNSLSDEDLLVSYNTVRDRLLRA